MIRRLSSSLPVSPIITMHETWQRNRLHYDSMQLRLLPWRKYRNRKKQLMFHTQTKHETHTFLERDKQPSPLCEMFNLFSSRKSLLFRPAPEWEGLIKRMGGRLRFKAEAITASPRLERTSWTWWTGMHASDRRWNYRSRVYLQHRNRLDLFLQLPHPFQRRGHLLSDVLQIRARTHTPLLKRQHSFIRLEMLTSSSSILRTCCTYL